MRFVDRSIVNAPPSLARANSPSQVELTEARNYYAANPAPTKCFDFAVYKSHDVRVALRNLFGGTCAYCEAIYEGTQQVDIEHYRPKGGVEENPRHPGYWWLAMRWENLLPSCADCNRRRKGVAATPGMTLDELQAAFEADKGSMLGKLNAFPTEDDHWALPEVDPSATERPLLIDPTREDPSAHLEWKLEGEIPILVPRLDAASNPSLKGQTSIDVYGLNRFGLAQSRRKILLLMEGLAKGLRLAVDSIDEFDDRKRQLQLDLINHLLEVLESFTEGGKPHASMALAYAERLKTSLRDKLERMDLAAT